MNEYCNHDVKTAITLQFKKPNAPWTKDYMTSVRLTGRTQRMITAWMCSGDRNSCSWEPCSEVVVCAKHFESILWINIAKKPHINVLLLIRKLRLSVVRQLAQVHSWCITVGPRIKIQGSLGSQNHFKSPNTMIGLQIGRFSCFSHLDCHVCP